MSFVFIHVQHDFDCSSGAPEFTQFLETFVIPNI